MDTYYVQPSVAWDNKWAVVRASDDLVIAVEPDRYFIEALARVLSILPLLTPEAQAHIRAEFVKP